MTKTVYKVELSINEVQLQNFIDILNNNDINGDEELLQLKKFYQNQIY